MILRNTDEKKKRLFVSEANLSGYEFERNYVLLNGALISLGLAAILDMLIPHWLLKWHRLVPNHTLSTYLEIALFIVGLVLFGAGIYREVKDRNHPKSSSV